MTTNTSATTAKTYQHNPYKVIPANPERVATFPYCYPNIPGTRLPGASFQEATATADHDNPINQTALSVFQATTHFQEPRENPAFSSYTYPKPAKARTSPSPTNIDSYNPNLAQSAFQRTFDFPQQPPYASQASRQNHPIPSLPDYRAAVASIETTLAGSLEMRIAKLEKDSAKSLRELEILQESFTSNNDQVQKTLTENLERLDALDSSLQDAITSTNQKFSELERTYAGNSQRLDVMQGSLQDLANATNQRITRSQRASEERIARLERALEAVHKELQEVKQLRINDIQAFHAQLAYYRETIEEMHRIQQALPHALDLQVDTLFANYQRNLQAAQAGQSQIFRSEIARLNQLIQSIEYDINTRITTLDRTRFQATAGIRR